MKVINLVTKSLNQDVVIPENDEELMYLEERFVAATFMPQGFPFSRGNGQGVVDIYLAIKGGSPMVYRSAYEALLKGYHIARASWPRDKYWKMDPPQEESSQGFARTFLDPRLIRDNDGNIIDLAHPDLNANDWEVLVYIP